MSYGELRFLYNNLITAATMITPGSQATGTVGGTERIAGTGSATMYALGAYTGSTDCTIIVKIDDTTAGNEIGQATFAWKYSTTAGWDGSGVTTSASATLLGSGVSIVFVAGTGNDFEGDEVWHTEARATYGKGNLIDLDRNNVFRSGVTFPIVIDLGSAQQVTAFALLDHNLTAATTTLTLQANSSDSWGSPAYVQALTVTDPLPYYLDQTYRYWRLSIVDSAITYVQIGELFLGTYRNLTVKNAKWGTPRTYGLTTVANVSQAGVLRRKVFAQQTKLSLNFAPKTIQGTDAANILTMRTALYSTTTGIIKPVFVHLFYDEVDTLFLMDWTNIEDFQRMYAGYGLNSMTFEFAEQVKTRG
jgi:hypothetical protein